MKTPIWIGVFLPKNIWTEKHLTLENQMVLFFVLQYIMNFLQKYILRKIFSFWNYYNTLFFFCNRLIFFIKHAFKTFYCKHIVYNFTFCRLLLYNLFRTIWLLGVFFLSPLKEIYWKWGDVLWKEYFMDYLIILIVLLIVLSKIYSKKD